jgi:hypothetical protein
MALDLLLELGGDVVAAKRPIGLEREAMDKRRHGRA